MFVRVLVVTRIYIWFGYNHGERNSSARNERNEMKQLDIHDELYQYIASNVRTIGESASTILRRLLNLNGDDNTPVAKNNQNNQTATQAPIDDTPATNDSQEQEVVTPVKQTNANVFNILNKEELAMQKGVVGRFLFILSAFYRTHKKEFSAVLDIKGRDRVYFATSKEDLVNSGSSMNPKNITDSEYWVMTNSNTTRKKMMLHEVALCLGYSAEQAEEIRDYL